MSVLFDARYIRTDFHDGISRYSTQLAHALANRMPVTFIICEPAQKKFLPKNAATVFLHPPTSVKEPFSAFFLNKYQPDVVFTPMQTLGSLGKKYKLILTIHDLIYYDHPTPPRSLPLTVRIGWRLYHLSYLPQRLLLNRADAVATVSESTKARMHEVHMTKRPVTVVPNAAPAAQSKTKTFNGPIQNLIYMGSFMPYKNVESLIDALEWLPGKTLHLLSKIRPADKARLKARIPTGASVVFHNGVSDEAYAALLDDCAVLVNASLNEGYGLPLAEALAQGAPLAVSDIPIFHEVAGKGAVYFDPKDPQDIATRIKTLDDPTQRTQLRQAGQEHVRHWNWDRSAERLEKLIKSLL